MSKYGGILSGKITFSAAANVKVKQLFTTMQKWEYRVLLGGNFAG